MNLTTSEIVILVSFSLLMFLMISLDHGKRIGSKQYIGGIEVGTF